MKIRAYALNAIVIVAIGSWLLGSCKSNKEIKNLSSQINCTKIIHFVWDDESNLVEYETRGAYKDGYAAFGKPRKLNHKEIFIQSIQEFNEKYEGDFIYTENQGFPSDSIIIVKVKLEKIIRDLGFSKIMTDMQLEYASTDQTFNILGSSNGYKGSKSYMKCFESANLQFLLLNCNN